MRRKKPAPFSLPAILSLFLIILILLILLPLKTKTPPKSPTFPKISSFPKSFFFSLLTSRPASHFPPLTSLIAVGDIMLGRYCNVLMLQKKDWRYPFLKTADLTNSADITFGNLEAPFVQDCPSTETGMIFCARPEAIEGLKFAGFDILSIANNHILNHGQKGLDQTKKLLKFSNILYSPLSSSNFSSNLSPNDISFGFLSFDFVTYPKTALPREDLAKWGPTVDILVVSLHWGNEYQKNPTESQKTLAHEIIDAGAKVIIGHHPHVTQPVEEYHGGLIFYSLGNFVFDQPWSEETKKGNIAKIIFEGKEIKSYELIPVYIQNYCQPILRS